MRTTSPRCTPLLIARTSTAERASAQRLRAAVRARVAQCKSADNIARQLDAAAADMAKMAMDYADLGEQLQVGAAAARQARGTCYVSFLRGRFFVLFLFPRRSCQRSSACSCKCFAGTWCRSSTRLACRCRGPSRRVTVLRARVDQQHPTPPPLCPHPPLHPSAPTHPPTPLPPPTPPPLPLFSLLQWDTTVRSMLKEKISRESAAAAAKYVSPFPLCIFVTL